MFAILYETGSYGFYLGFDENLESVQNRFSKITDDLLKKIRNGNIAHTENYFEMYGVFNVAKYCTDYQCYKISSHKNQLRDYELIFPMADFSLYIIKIREKFNPCNIRRNQNYFFYTINNHIDGTIELIIN